MKSTLIIWQKYTLCVGTALLLALTLLLLSNWVLKVEPYLQAVSILCTIMMAFGLSSLSIGLGALLPNFKEDNPARIANGLGGTANALLSLMYVAVTVGMLGIPIHMYSKGQLESAHLWQRWWLPYVSLFIAVQLAAILLPMVLGIRKWKRLEF